MQGANDLGCKKALFLSFVHAVQPLKRAASIIDKVLQIKAGIKLSEFLNKRRKKYVPRFERRTVS